MAICLLSTWFPDLLIDCTSLGRIMGPLFSMPSAIGCRYPKDALGTVTRVYQRQLPFIMYFTFLIFKKSILGTYAYVLELTYDN